MGFDIKEFAKSHNVDVRKVRDFFELGKSYVLDNGDVVLPEEFDFYNDEYNKEFGGAPQHDWFAEDDLDTGVITGDGAINVTPSEWTEFAVRIPNKGIPEPFDFAQRRYLRDPYDIHCYRLLLMCGRQVEKSTLVGNSILARMAIVPHYRALYVSPTHEQTKVFRRDRIGDPIQLSEIYQNYISPKHANNMSIIKFVNYSQLVLRYAYLNADRVRGIPADAVYIDEIQDILTTNIPVIEECAGHANPELKMFVYSGTPKSHDNTIEHLWIKRSTQNEWAVPNDRRQIHDMTSGDAKSRFSKYYWNVPLDEGNIGQEGLICKKYGNLINPAHPDARWVSMNPSIRNHPRTEPFESYRIPQLMVPWIQWKDILDKMENYARAKFYNEVLAISYDSGTRPLRMQDLMEHSLDNIQMNAPIEAIRRAVAGTQVFMGIDWGTGENTYTIVTLGAYVNGVGGKQRFVIFYFKRYTGIELDPEIQLEDIHRLVSMFKPAFIGADYGGGFDRNKKLINRYGPQRVIRYQYIGGHGGGKRAKLSYDSKKGRYLVDRTEVMSDMFNAIREGKLGFPRWQDWAEPYAQDFLSIFSEYNETTRMVQYDKAPDMTDDSFHAALYCFFASMLMYARPDIVRPTYEPNSIG